MQYSQILRNNSNNVEAEFATARALQYKGDDMSALGVLRRVCELQPQFEKAKQFAKVCTRSSDSMLQLYSAWKSKRS